MAFEHMLTVLLFSVLRSTPTLILLLLDCDPLLQQVMEEHVPGCHAGGRCWLCWFCPRDFLGQTARNRHMSVKHPRRNRLVPPPGFVELHLRSSPGTRPSAEPGPCLSDTPGVADAAFLSSVDAVGESRHSAAELLLPGTRDVAADAGSSGQGAVHRVPNEAGAGHPELGGVGIVRVPTDGYVRGALPVNRPRTVFFTSTAARVRAYYESMPEANKTRRLVHPSVGQQPSRFNSPLLREVLKFALSVGGAGLSTADQGWYMSVLLMAETGGVASCTHDDGCDGEGGPQRSRPGRDGVHRRKRPRLAPHADGEGGVPDDNDDARTGATGDDGEGTWPGSGELARAFPAKSSFVAAVRDEQRRVLSKLFWDETPLEVEGVSYLFYSRDLLLAVLDLLQHAGHVQLWGEKLGVGPDGTRLRSEILDSDLFLTEEVVVRRRHGSLSFVLAVQLFLDEAVVSWSGAHYVYPVRARVLNVRDRSVQWVTVGYVPHVGKPVARTAVARRRASDARNGVLQRCLAILLRRFVGASQDGVEVEFPGQRKLTAVPRLIGLVADQLGERSAACLMGNACEFFCSHCVVRRDVAGGPDGVGAAPRDVTAVLDAQLEAAITRDRDPRPSLRNHLRVVHSALAFVPAIGAVWGLSTDNKRLYDIISFDLLHVWKLGVVRMVAQRFPSFLRVACVGQDARLGPVPATLEALNLRAWEMGHLCIPSPTPPGYVLAFLSFLFWRWSPPPRRLHLSHGGSEVPLPSYDRHPSPTLCLEAQCLPIWCTTPQSLTASGFLCVPFLSVSCTCPCPSAAFSCPRQRSSSRCLDATGGTA